MGIINIIKNIMCRKKYKESKKNSKNNYHSDTCIQNSNEYNPYSMTDNDVRYRDKSNGTYPQQNSHTNVRTMQIAPLIRTMPENHAATIAVIYRSELDYLSRCIADYPECETGGHLFGYWTVQGVPVILYATGPGPNCMHGSVECHHDHEYYTRIRDILENTIALQHIGDWHSHHQLSLNHPSGGDVHAMLAGVGNQPGMLRRHLMCIGTYNGEETFVDAYTFHQNEVPDYTHAAWTIVEMMSPFRSMADSLLSGFLINPATLYPKMGKLFTINELISDALNDTVESSPKLYWLDDTAENRKILKKFIKETEFFHSGKKVEAMTTEDNHVFLNIENGGQSILFAKPFPESPPYYFNGDEIVQVETLWNTEEYSLEFCYSQWLSAIVAKINGSEIIEKKTTETLDHISDEIQKNDDEDNNARVTSVEIGSIDQTNAPSSQSCDTNIVQNPVDN